MYIIAECDNERGRSITAGFDVETVTERYTVQAHIGHYYKRTVHDNFPEAVEAYRSFNGIAEELDRRRSA